MLLPQEQLKRLLDKAIAKAYAGHHEIEIVVESTSDAKFGDYTSTVALKLGKLVKQEPREVAQNLVAQLGLMSTMLDKAEVAGPGFINFFLKPKWLIKQVDGILLDKKYGQNDSGKNQRLMVEFISANPTGPLTLGNGRGAFAGDTLASVLTMNGWNVWREYYLNDMGNQVNILAESVIRRYFQQQGIPTDYPETCYQGEYVNDLAKKLKIESLKLRDMTTLRERIKQRVLETMIKDLQRIVEKTLHIKFNAWFRESSLYRDKLHAKGLEKLRSHDLVYQKDGATWFRTTAFGDDKDRVLIKQDGELTYLLSDIALRWFRFEARGFNREIIFLGADHHGYVNRLKATMAALGHAHKLNVVIVQLVRLMKDGQEVKMSKRAGTYVTLEELVDELDEALKKTGAKNPGLDVARFFFVMHAADTHMDFNMDLAKEKSDKNPVFYVQYAHARICSILAKTKKLKTFVSPQPPHPAEVELVKKLLDFPSLIAEIGQNYETQKLPFYAISLASAFHAFYGKVRVIDNNAVNTRALGLIKATKLVLAKTLSTMGVSAPEKMNDFKPTEVKPADSILTP